MRRKFRASQLGWYALQIGVFAALLWWLKETMPRGEPFNAYAAALLCVIAAFIVTLSILIIRGQWEHWSSVVAARRSGRRGTGTEIAEPDSERSRLRATDRGFRELPESSRRLRIGE